MFDQALFEFVILGLILCAFALGVIGIRYLVVRICTGKWPDADNDFYDRITG